MFNAVLDDDGHVLASNLPADYLRRALDAAEIEPTDATNVYRLLPAPLRVLSAAQKRRRHLQSRRA